MTPRRWIPASLAATVLLVPACGRQLAQPTAPAPQLRTAGTLYQRLGGYDALAAVTDDFLRRMLADPELAPFFEELTTPEKDRVRQMLVDQLCAATRGPCVYVGQDMETVHRALGITATDWDRAVGLLLGTLNALGVRPREREEVLAIVASLRDQIVQP